MCRTAAFLCMLLASIACKAALAQELTLTAEFIIFDCANHRALFDQYMDDNLDVRKKQEVALTLRQEVPVRDQMKCVLLMTVGQPALCASGFGGREIRVIAKPQPKAEDGQYPMELGLSCFLPPEGRGNLGGSYLGGSSNWSPNRRLPLNTVSTPGSAASGIELGIWFVTLAEGRPEQGVGREFLDIHPGP